jgi:hypothetical protein
VANFPTRAADLRPAAASAAEAAFGAASAIGSAEAVSACTAAARVAAAAARAASDSLATAAAAAQELETAFADARKVPTVFSELTAAGAVSDMKALDLGMTVDELLGRELWLDGIPPPVQSEWYKIETAQKVSI